MSKKKKILPKLRFPDFLKDEDWVKQSLGEVAEIITGNTPSTKERSYYGGELMFVSPADISDSRIVNQTKTTLTELGFSKTRQIEANSVLFVCIGSTIGKIAQNKYKCATNQQINSLVPCNGYSSDFLYSILDYNSTKIASIAGNHVVPIINKTTFSAIIIEFPPRLEEQHKIASCLSSLDDLIAAHNDKLEILKEHKKGLMQNLFPQDGQKVPNYRFPEFQDDDKWVKTKLGDAADFINGKAYKQKELLSEEKYRVLRVGNLFTNNKWYYSDLELDEDKYCENGDLLFAWSASFGPHIWKEEKVIYHYHIWKVKNKYGINKEFLFNLLDYETLRMKNKTLNGFALMHITKGAIENWESIIPSNPKEQQKIASCLSAVDELITAQSDKIEQLQQHKKGLMQGLFPKIES